MKAKRAILFGGVAALLVVGIYGLKKRQTTPVQQLILPGEAQAVFENPEQFTLLSLDPYLARKGDKNNFAGWRLLGQTNLNAHDQKELVAAFYEALEEARANSPESFDLNAKGGLVSCFEPRHGLQARRGNKIINFVICFECRQMTSGFSKPLNKAKTLHRIEISSSPKTLFNRILDEAKVPRDKTADHLR